MVSASQRRSAVRYLAGRYAVSERRGCAVTGTARSTFQYKSARPSQEALRQKIRDLALSRVRYGYKRIHVLLKRQGVHVNKEARLSPVLPGRLAVAASKAQAACEAQRPSNRHEPSCGRRTWPGRWTSSVIRPSKERVSGH